MSGPTSSPEASAAKRALSALLEARTGQSLSTARSWRIEASLKPIMRELGLTALDALVARLANGTDQALAVKVVEALLNNESSFFRDAAAFAQLDCEALETLRTSRADRRHLRIWSAACSTGQEAYSLTMMLRDASQRWAGWTFDILATDASSSMVERARQGRYSRFEIQRGLPARTMLRWFREDGDDWVADASLSRAIRFATHDIRLPAPGTFDLILCRNVLMYFPVHVRTGVFDLLADALDPGGILMLGAGETVLGQTDRFKPHPSMRGLYAAASEVSQSPSCVVSR